MMTMWVNSQSNSFACQFLSGQHAKVWRVRRKKSKKQEPKIQLPLSLLPLYDYEQE